MKDYYKRELSLINTTGEYAPNVCIRNQNETDKEQPRHFDLNAESAQALADFLKERFNVIAR